MAPRKQVKKGVYLKAKFTYKKISKNLKLFDRGHSFSTNTKFSKKLTFLTRTCAYHELRSVTFSENFACVLNE